MIQFKHVTFLLIFYICNHAHALDSASHYFRPDLGGKKIECPSRDFSEFIKAFSENKEVQMAFTKYPLTQQQLDLNAEPEPKPIVQKLRRDQVSFPVMPNRADIKSKDLSIELRSVSTQTAKVIIYKHDTDYQISYKFEANDCWNLISINDESLTQSGSENNWLERLFPAINDCTPRNFYFDENTKYSNDRLLERLGYLPYKIDENLARYKINEKFYGFTATEIGIPSGTNSIYFVTVSSEVLKLSKKILKKTGIQPNLYNEKFKAKSGFAYLTSENKDKSSFICFTFEE